MDARFEAALDLIKNLPPSGAISLSNTEKLTFYALYKQASSGDCQGSRPGWFDPVNRAKWDAWDRARGLSKEEAKEKYVTAILETVDRTIADHPEFAAGVADQLRKIRGESEAEPVTPQQQTQQVVGVPSYRTPASSAVTPNAYQPMGMQTPVVGTPAERRAASADAARALARLEESVARVATACEATEKRVARAEETLDAVRRTVGGGGFWSEWTNVAAVASISASVFVVLAQAKIVR